MSEVFIEVIDRVNQNQITKISGWQNCNISSTLFNQSDAFTLEITPTQEMRHIFITSGHEVRVYVDDEWQMSGIIDTLAKSSSTDGISLTISGRDFGGLLVDDTPPMITYANQTLRQIVEKLIARHSNYIDSIITDNSASRFIVAGKKGKTGTKSPVYRGIDTERTYQTRTKPGDKIFDVINKLAEEIACHVWMSVSGQLIIARPQYSQASDIYGEGLYQKCDSNGNIVSSNCNVSWDPSISNRFSDYNVTGQGTPTATAVGKTLSDH